MSINVNDKNLGHATAYAYYKAGGGTMTEAEFTEFMADFGTASQTAVEAAQAALASKNAAQTAATTATNKATEATTAATTATTKAGEASTSASTATSAKDTAVSAASTATTKATEATTAAATATSAKTDAVAANTAAQSAKTAAQTAQAGAETAAASVQSSAAQIQTNADDISELKEDTTQLMSEFTAVQELVTYTSVSCTVANGTLQNTGNANAVYTTDYAPVVAGGWGQVVINRPVSADGNYYKYGWIVYDSSKSSIQSVQIIDGNLTGLVGIPENGAYIRYSVYEYNADETLHTLRKTEFSDGDVVVKTIYPDNLAVKVDDLEGRVDNLETGGIHEYRYEGEKINTQHGVDLAQYSWYMPSPAVGDASALQGVAIYNDQIFQFLPTNKCVRFPVGSPNSRAVFDATCGHGNSADFSATKYDDSDNYPMCYVSDWLNEGSNKVYALRLTDTSATLIKTYTFPFADAGYYAGACVDTRKNIIYLTGYSKPNASANVDNANNLVVSAWNMNSETNNGDGTYSFAKIKTFEIPVFVPTMQDRCFKYGKIFVLSSPANNPTTVYCISPNLQQIVSVMDEFHPVFTTQEVEGMAFISENELFMSYYGRPWKAVF